MINLLPASEIKKTRVEYRMRLAVTALSLLVLVMLIAIVSLLPAYVLMSHKRAALSGDLSNILQGSARSEEQKNLETILKETDAAVEMLGGNTKGLSVSRDIVEKFAGYKTASIKIKGIFYDAKGTEGSLAIKGTAANRQSLTDLVDMLKKDKMFKNVTLPISDLVKDKDIDFNITMKVAGEERTAPSSKKEAPETNTQGL